MTQLQAGAAVSSTAGSSQQHRQQQQAQAAQQQLLLCSRGAVSDFIARSFFMPPACIPTCARVNVAPCMKAIACACRYGCVHACVNMCGCVLLAICEHEAEVVHEAEVPCVERVWSVCVHVWIYVCVY